MNTILKIGLLLVVLIVASEEVLAVNEGEDLQPSEQCQLVNVGVQGMPVTFEACGQVLNYVLFHTGEQINFVWVAQFNDFPRITTIYTSPVVVTEEGVNEAVMEEN